MLSKQAVEVSSSNKKVASQLLRHFLFATQEVLLTQLSLAIKEYGIVGAESSPAESVDLAAVINIVSSTHQCTVTLSFPTASFLAFYEKMLGEKIVSVEKENADAASEILNMIFGVAKRRFNPEGFDFLMAIPFVVTGKGLDLSHFHKTKLSSVKCVTEAGNVYLDLSVVEITEKT